MEQDKESAIREDERAAIIARMRSHLIEPQVMVETTVYDTEYEVAIKECIGIVECRSDGQ